MSTKQTKQTRLRPALPALAGQRDRDEIQAKFQQVRALQQQYAATIIAAGVFGADPAWDDVLGALADVKATESYQALNGLFDRLEQASPNSTRIPFRYLPTDSADSTEWATDVLTAHATSWGDVGFLLGLAVGMQLGPHAFEGLDAPAPKAGRR